MRSIRYALALLAVIFHPDLSQAAYPTRLVTIVVPTSAGGPADILARILAQKMSEDWHQPVIVENRSGSNQILGLRSVAASEPDGYRLLVVNDGPMTMNRSLFKDVGYNPKSDFTPIANVAWIPLVLVINPKVPAKTVSELVTYLRANPGKFNYAAGGSTTQLAAELFKSMTDTDVQGVMYRGSAQAIPSVMSGEVQMMIDAIASSLPYIRADKLRALAVAGGQRSSILPDLPTISEAGVPGYGASTWLGLFGPAKLPSDIRDTIQDEVKRIIAQPEVRDRMLKIGFEPAGGSPAALATMIEEDSAKWSKVIGKLGIKKQ